MSGCLVACSDESVSLTCLARCPGPGLASGCLSTSPWTGRSSPMEALVIRPTRLLAAVAAAALVAAPLVAGGTASASPLTYDKLHPMQKRLLSGSAALDVNAAQSAQAAQEPPFYYPKTAGTCGGRIGSEVKVNQDCANLSDPDLLGRGQAQNETSIAHDPNNPQNMVAGSNDYRRGDSNCYGYYSLNGGKNWRDSTIPMSFTRGDRFGKGILRQYWTTGGDTSVAWDTKGNAYLSCQVFTRGRPVSSNPDLSSAFYVFRSTQNNGASWNFPGRPVAESGDTRGAGTQPFLDKQLMAVDNHEGSPHQDAVYVTWTTFAPDGSAYIFASHSYDYAETFSKPVLVSRNSPLCVNTYGVDASRGKCNQNQFSQPFVAPDGTLYVTWANYNNAETVRGNDNRYQMLLARSTDGGRSFSQPVKVGNYYELPDCAPYQDGKNAFRSCVPEKGDTSNSVFRAANYPVGAVNPANPDEVVVTYGSYVNRNSNERNGCVPRGFDKDTFGSLYRGVKAAGACNNDIVLSVSDNGGRTFTGTTTDPRELPSVTDQAGQRRTDQWFHWAAYSENGTFAASYYDRQYGNASVTGFSDVSLSGSRDLSTFGATRVTSSSMPPPTQFEGTFWGDYTGLTVAGNTAYPNWSDTRAELSVLCPGTATRDRPPAVCGTSASNADRANDQDTVVRGLPVPTG